MFHWVVGCTKEQIIFVECTAGDKYPLIMPSYIPNLCSLHYSAPLLPQTSEGENQLFVARTNLQNISEPADKITKRQQMDKSLLRLFHSSCNEDKLQRALDFANLLMFPKAVDIAIQVASSANISSLVEHLHQVKQQILDNIAESEPVTPIIVERPVTVRQNTQIINNDEVSEISEDISEKSEKENLPEPARLSEQLRQQSKSPKQKPVQMNNKSKLWV